MSDLSNLIGQIYETVVADTAVSRVTAPDQSDVVAGHVRRAAELRVRLSELEYSVNLLQATLDRISSAVFLLDREGRLVYVNRAGQFVLDRGEFLTLDHGIVLPCDPQWSSRSLLASTSVTLRNSQGKTVSASLQILAPQTQGYPNAYAALVIAEPPHQKAPDLRTLLGLSLSEARLADALVHGRTLPELTTRWHLSRETLKSQLAGLFRKTGTHRQAQLVAFLLSLVVGSM